MTVTSFECWAINGAGKRIDNSESCVVSISGATILNLGRRAIPEIRLPPGPVEQRIYPALLDRLLDDSRH